MKTKNVLVLNLLHENHFKTSFDNRLQEALKPIAPEYATLYLDDLENFADFNNYTHLLISGSTESATDERPWYAELDKIISRFISEGKSILGICFGHQFIVRHIMGKNHVRKSQTPEIGWTEIAISDNPLFEGMSSLKSAVFHYDEVFELDDRFEVTADSGRCTVHGFQVKGKNIWGVQFHPDFMYQNVFEFMEMIEDTDDRFEQICCKTAVSRQEFLKNDQIFKNWVKTS